MNEQRYSRLPWYPAQPNASLCTECGALVADEAIHDRFHARLVEDDWFGLDPSEVRTTKYVRGDGHLSVGLVHTPSGINTSGDGPGAVAAARQRLAALLAVTTPT